MSKNIAKIISSLISEDKKTANALLESYILQTSRRISEDFDKEDNIVDDRTSSIIDDLADIEREEYYGDVDLNEEADELTVDDLEDELTAHEISDLNVQDRVTSLEDQMRELRNHFDTIIGGETVPDYEDAGFDSEDDIAGLQKEFEDSSSEFDEEELDEGKTSRGEEGETREDIIARYMKKKEDLNRKKASSEKREELVTEETSGDFEMEPFEIDLEDDNENNEKSPVPSVPLDQRSSTTPVEYVPNPENEFDVGSSWETGPIYKNMNNTSEDYFSDYFEKERKKSITDSDDENEDFPVPSNRPLYPVTENRKRKV